MELKLDRYLGKKVHIAYEDGKETRGIKGLFRDFDTNFVYLLPSWSDHDIAISISSIKHIRKVGDKP